MIKKFIFTTLVSALLIISANTVSAAGPTDCKNPQDWRSFGGFTHENCPNGLGYPTMNAYLDENIFSRNDPKTASQFAFVRNSNNTNNQANFGYANETNITSNGVSAQFFLYTHNSGNPKCNTNDAAVLRTNNCSQSTIAKNVRVKIIGGLTRTADGNYESEPGTRHRITFQISSDNTTPARIQDSMVINTEPNKVVRLSRNAERNLLSVRGIRNSYVSTDLLSNGVLLASSFNGSGDTTNYFASEDYRVMVYGGFDIVDAPAAETCEALTLSAPTNVSSDLRSAEFTINVKSSLSRNETTARLNQALNETFTARPRADSLVFSDLTYVQNFILPGDTYRFRVTKVDAGDSFTVRLKGFSNSNTDCAKSYTFPTTPPATTACIKFDLKRTVSGENTVFSVDNVQPASYDNARNNVVWTIERRGRQDATKKITESISVATDEMLQPGTKVSVRLENLDDDGGGCNGEYIVPDRNAVCEKFDITPQTVLPSEALQEFQITGISPQNFDGNVAWTVKNAAGTVIFPSISNPNNIKNIYQKISFGALQNDFTISAKLNVTNPGDCQDEVTVTNTSSNACETLRISPRTINASGSQTFTATTSPESNYSLTWSILNKDGTVNNTAGTGYSFTVNDTTNISAIAVKDPDRLTNLSPCRDKIDKTDTPPEPPEELACEKLELINLKTGRKITNGSRLPSDNKVLQFRVETTPSDYENDVEENIDNLNVIKDGDEYTVFGARNNSSLEIFVPGEPNCQIELEGSDGPGEEVTFKKFIKDPNSGAFRTDYAFVNIGPVDYKVELDSELENVSSIELIDDINNGIPGLRNGSDKPFGRLIGDVDDRITNNRPYGYQGLITWDNRNDDCKLFTGDCSIRFKNQATAEIFFRGTPIENTGSPRMISNSISIASNETYAIVLCPFILSRGFGDVFTSQGFDGANVAACGARNTQSPVFTELPQTEQEIVSTGSLSNANSPSHSICESANKSQNLGALKGIFNSDQLKNFSSATCQVALNNAERWQKAEIIKNLLNVFNRIAPKVNVEKTLNSIGTTGFNKNRIATYSKLTLDNSANPVNITESTARTIVVYGDININSNLEYTGTGTLALVSIGGDIIFAPGVEKAQAIFVTIPVNNQGGSLIWDKNSKETISPIEIKGSVFGNINPLLEGVSGSALSKDRGEVTVIFDGRIIRKIPPGLQDVIKFNQFQTATGNKIFDATTD